MYRAKGDYDRAIRDFDQALKLNPKYALASKNRAAALAMKSEKKSPSSDRSAD